LAHKQCINWDEGQDVQKQLVTKFGESIKFYHTAHFCGVRISITVLTHPLHDE
jgi:hypothetical protein